MSVFRVQRLADTVCELDDRRGEVGRVVDRDGEDESVQVEFSDRSSGWLPVSALCSPSARGTSGANGDGTSAAEVCVCALCVRWQWYVHTDGSWVD